MWKHNWKKKLPMNYYVNFVIISYFSLKFFFFFLFLFSFYYFIFCYFIFQKLTNRLKGVEVIAKDMPDPYQAKEKIWVPFLLELMGNGDKTPKKKWKTWTCVFFSFVDNEETILIGHSSGAEAIMRLAEKTKGWIVLYYIIYSYCYFIIFLVRAIVLVSACWTDLGEPSETISGYYSRPWLWNQIVSNCGWILQFGSTNDPFIPISEGNAIKKRKRKRERARKKTKRETVCLFLFRFWRNFKITSKQHITFVTIYHRKLNFWNIRRRDILWVKVQTPFWKNYCENLKKKRICNEYNVNLIWDTKLECCF